MSQSNLLLTCFFLFNLTLLHSQTLSPEIVSSSGSFFSNGTNQLSWTLGEPVISTESAGNYILTQGFHQTLLSANSVNYVGNTEIKVFPNPTQDLLQIKLGSTADDFYCELYDIVGRSIKTLTVNQSNTAQLSLAEFSAGNYLLKISDYSNRLIQTFKVQKLR